MQKVRLPLRIDPIKDAQRRVELDGIYAKSTLMRLINSVEDVLNDAQVSLSFFIDAQKLAVMKGQAQVDVMLICQRCGEPFVHSLCCEFLCSPVKSVSQIDELPEIYEPIEIDQFGEVDLLALIEDEFMLALPLVAKHPLEHCEVSVLEQVFGELPIDVVDKPNPFSVLANLKKN